MSIVLTGFITKDSVPNCNICAICNIYYYTEVKLSCWLLCMLLCFKWLIIVLISKLIGYKLR